MKNLLIIIALFIMSCSSWKNRLQEEVGDKNTGIHNVIADFSHKSSLYRKNKVFSISIQEINEEKIVIGILPTEDKFLPMPEDTIGNKRNYIPTNFFVKEGKLFYWNDSNKSLSEEIVNLLHQFNLIDSININGFIEIPEGAMIIDERQKGVDYYLCRNNLKNYKKVTTRIGYGYYPAPQLNCAK